MAQPDGVPGGGGAAGDPGGLAIPNSSAVQRRLELDSGLRLRVGLDRGRMAAEQDRHPCALQLTATGWQPPPTAACRGGVMPDGDRCR